MSLLDKLDKFEQKEEPLQQLKPPKPPKIIIEEPTKDLKIDFDKIAKKSYFQRFIQNLFKDILPEQFKGVDFKASREIAVERFDNKINEINEVYNVAEQLKREKKGDYAGVMKEFKELLKKREERLKNE